MGFAVERRERGGMNRRRFSEVLWLESSSSGDWSTVVGNELQETLSPINLLDLYVDNCTDTPLVISTLL